MLRISTLLVLAIALTHAAAAPAVAQPAPPPPPPFREGTVNFSLVQTSGNSDTQSLGLDGDIIFRPPDWELRNKAAFVRVETDDVITAQAFAYLSRAARKITDRLSGYGQYDYARDVLGGIRHRNVVTGGALYRVLQRAAHTLDAFAGLGYANERRVRADTVSTAVFDGGSAYKWKFSEAAEFSDDFRFNQSLSDGADWRIGQLAAVTARLTTILSLKVANDVRFRNDPPPGFEKRDVATSIALVAKF